MTLSFKNVQWTVWETADLKTKFIAVCDPIYLVSLSFGRKFYMGAVFSIAAPTYSCY